MSRKLRDFQVKCKFIFHQTSLTLPLSLSFLLSRTLTRMTTSAVCGIGLRSSSKRPIMTSKTRSIPSISGAVIQKRFREAFGNLRMFSVIRALRLGKQKKFPKFTHKWIVLVFSRLKWHFEISVHLTFKGIQQCYNNNTSFSSESAI